MSQHAFDNYSQAEFLWHLRELITELQGRITLQEQLITKQKAWIAEDTEKLRDKEAKLSEALKQATKERVKKKDQALDAVMSTQENI